ncbi:uncharacterized protein LOC122537470 [Frieseomelitta varia]|uniref:uncharacterized protein LOC122537470 n=1 Tax=Frieseomelitta varia TaxID=561572 RepID=UPI001CB6B1BF|nr:uncharacterized protein LOC122537470 [Frieseomelitta varia]
MQEIPGNSSYLRQLQRRPHCQLLKMPCSLGLPQQEEPAHKALQRPSALFLPPSVGADFPPLPNKLTPTLSDPPKPQTHYPLHNGSHSYVSAVKSPSYQSLPPTLDRKFHRIHPRLKNSDLDTFLRIIELIIYKNIILTVQIISKELKRPYKSSKSLKLDDNSFIKVMLWNATSITNKNSNFKNSSTITKLTWPLSLKPGSPQKLLS